MMDLDAGLCAVGDAAAEGRGEAPPPDRDWRPLARPEEAAELDALEARVKGLTEEVQRLRDRRRRLVDRVRSRRKPGWRP